MEFPYTEDERKARYAEQWNKLAQQTIARIGDILAERRVPVRLKSFLMAGVSTSAILVAKINEVA